MLDVRYPRGCETYVQDLEQRSLAFAE